ncbi:tat protein [Simian immunodeficiency virus]|uniref:Protein Tat n=1 Tax=Simian immunodeficiency virus TaxID=11723 RepID=A0A159D7N3_SIV|nr:tat protein [Simian immunodeficiency virus]
MDRAEGQHPLQDLHKPLEACFNKCYCKKCCYHCQLCFLQKGLGINYAPRTRRKKTASPDTLPQQHQSISTRGRDSQTTQESQKTVAATTRTSQSFGRKNLGTATGGSAGTSD